MQERLYAVASFVFFAKTYSFLKNMHNMQSYIFV